MPFSPSEYARWYCEKYAPSPGRLEKRLRAKFPEQSEIITALVSEYRPLAEKLIEGSIDQMRRAWFPWRKIADKLKRADWDKAFTQQIMSDLKECDSEDDWLKIESSICKKYEALLKKGYTSTASIRTLYTLFPEHKSSILELLWTSEHSLEAIWWLVKKKYPNLRDEKTRARATRYLAGRWYGWDEINSILHI